MIVKVIVNEIRAPMMNVVIDIAKIAKKLHCIPMKVDTSVATIPTRIESYQEFLLWSPSNQAFSLFQAIGLLRQSALPVLILRQKILKPLLVRHSTAV